MTRQVEREVMGVMLTAHARVAAEVLHQSGGSDGSVIGAIVATRSLSVIADDTLKALVSQARAEGHTWAEIGDVLRVTRQAAFQRFGSAALAEEPRVAGPPVEGAVERTAGLVADLLAGRWEIVAKDFTPKMIEILPRELLESTRAQVAQHWGELLRTGQAEVTTRDGFTVVDLPLEFARRDASCRAVFTSSGQVAGLLCVRGLPPGRHAWGTVIGMLLVAVEPWLAYLLIRPHTPSDAQALAIASAPPSCGCSPTGRGSADRTFRG